MKWVKYEEIKDSLNPGEVLVATFFLPDSKKRVLCMVVVDVDNGLRNVTSGNKITNISPDYVIPLECPDQYPFSLII